MNARYYVTALNLKPDGEVTSERPFFTCPEDAIGYAQREMTTNRTGHRHRHVVEIIAEVRPKPLEVVVQRFKRLVSR